MVALADVFRRFADDYLSRHGASVLPSHRRAIADILACRTHTLGGHLWRCNQCSSEVYSYHSCKNRSCPRCHKDQTERWIAAREVESTTRQMAEIIASHSGRDVAQVLQDIDRDRFMTPPEAVEYGLVDDVLAPLPAGGGQ